MQHNSRHLFLCAVGRSGTTIFRTSLGKHPQIYYNGFENNVVQDVAEVAARNCTMPSRQKSMAVDQESYDASFRGLLNALIWPDEDLGHRPVHFAAINPLANHLDYLQQLYPQGKFICLVRNGIEVVSSRMRYDSFAASEFETQCRVWIRSQQVCQWGDQHRDLFRLFRHQWLYDPQKLELELSNLYSWIGIDHSPAPAEHVLATLRHPTETEMEIAKQDFSQTSTEQRQAYFQSKRDRWKDWSDDQRDTFCEICGPFMEQLGYKIPWS